MTDLKIGEFVSVEREISLKPNTTNTYKHTGVIVKKCLKDYVKRSIYWFADEYEYVVSIPEYGGDYIVMNDTSIIKPINLSIINKLYIISKFGDWWFKEYKSIYQELLIEALQN